MKKLGRPKTVGRDKGLNCRMSQEELELVNSEAKKHGKSQADFILWCIEQTLKQEKEAGE